MTRVGRLLLPAGHLIEIMPCNLATDYVAIRLGVEGDVLINTSVTCACACVRVFSGWSFAYGAGRPLSL